MEEEKIFDVIPIQIGEMYPKNKQIWHFKNDIVIWNFERITKRSQGLILKNGTIVGKIK